MTEEQLFESTDVEVQPNQFLLRLNGQVDPRQAEIAQDLGQRGVAGLIETAVYRT